MSDCEASTSGVEHQEFAQCKGETRNESEIDGEIIEAEKILNAFLCYGLHGREVMCRTMMSFKQLSPAHKDIILKSHNEHMHNVLKCIDHNQEILKKIVIYGLNVFGEEFAEKTWKIRQKRRPDPHYMGKVISTLRQIVREWSSEGKAERDATFVPLMEILRHRYPNEKARGDVKIMVPGSGLGRLAFDLARDGFCVEGNEFSMIMLMTSSFLLNACFKENEHVIYPFTLDKSNTWSYDDQTRPIYFPDTGKTKEDVPMKFSMIAGDFLEVTQSRSETFDCIVTAWFIDTAKNVIDYIETIHRLLKRGGCWLNVGPLTYHYEDMMDEMSIELPYDEVMRIVRLSGFEVMKEEKITNLNDSIDRNMSLFHNVELLPGIIRHSDLASSWSWSKYITGMSKMDDKDKATEQAEWSKESGDGKGEFLDDGRMWPYVVPVDAFGEHIFGEYTDKLREGVVVEYLMREYDDLMENNVKCMWLAKIIKIAGYRILLRWIGADEEGDDRYDFWVNIGSRILHAVGYGGSIQTNKLTYTYMPPKFIADRWTAEGEDSVAKHIQSTMIPLQHVRTLRRQFEQDRKRIITEPVFKVNDRVELLDYNNSTRVRPARVKKIVGRRICVHVREDDFDGEVDDDDRQFGDDSEFWVDQSSFYMFHVGWACYNNYGLGSTKEYRRHAQQIADALAKGECPPYASCDVTPQKISSWNVNKDAPFEWKKGMRFELMDPLAQMFNELRVASVLEVLKGGYLRVGMDGPDVESECIPLHCTSSFMFPVGYAQKYNIKLGGPNDTEEFNWDNYLQQAGAIAAPESLFRPVPDEKFMDHFQIGAKLEASDMCENHLVCPATVAAHKGRLLQIHFDGWEDTYDQLFDVHSCDIFPLGWCEMHGYKLEPPKAEEEQPAKKKKKK